MQLPTNAVLSHWSHNCNITDEGDEHLEPIRDEAEVSFEWVETHGTPVCGECGDDMELADHLTVYPNPSGMKSGDPKITLHQAMNLKDDDGFITTTITVPTDELLMHYLHPDNIHLAVEDDHFDYLHKQIFNFGNPHTPEFEIVLINSESAIVTYSTNIDGTLEAIAMPDELGNLTT